MGEASRRRAITEFAWPQIVACYEQAWTELAQCSRHFEPPTLQPIGILPAFFRAFAGYASDILTGQSRVRVRPDAASGISEEQPLPLEVGLDVERVTTGLGRVVASRDGGGGELTTEQLAAARGG